MGTSGSESQKKLCQFCGADVAGKPRAKDAAGRYACKACVDAGKLVGATKPAAAAPKAADAGDELSLRDLALLAKLEAAQAPVELTPEQGGCANCGRFIGEALVCIRCGYDTRRKRVVSTKITKDKA